MGTKTTELVAITDIASDDLLFGVDVSDTSGSANGTNKKFTKASLLQGVAPLDPLVTGWIPADETWAFASASSPTYTFTIAGDQREKYSVGMKIKLTQSSEVKYFTIRAVAYSSPNTAITIYGGDSFTLANTAITEPHYSMMENPQGFPQELGIIDIILGPMTGMVSMFAGSSAPNGYLMCDGSAINRSTYSTLFSVIGTIWGSGDGSTTFNLPDFRGIYPKGAGTTSRAAGKDAVGNYYSATLGTYYTDKFQGHWHNVGFSETTSPDKFGAVSGGSGVWGSSGEVTSNARYLVAKAPIIGTNGTPRVGNSTEPQGAGINFVIKT